MGVAADVRLSGSGSGESAPVVRLSGLIVDGDALALQRLLRQVTTAGKAATVFLDSEGGDVDEAMAIGQAIRAVSATTIHGTCASACVYAFLGGRERFVSPEGGLSIHRPTLAEANITQPTAMGTRMLDVLRNYIVTMTGSATLYEATMRVPFTAPQTLLPGEARAMGVATRLLP